MAIKIQQLERSFSYNGVSLPDPGAALSLEAVRDVYSAAFLKFCQLPLKDRNKRATNFFTFFVKRLVQRVDHGDINEKQAFSLIRRCLSNHTGASNSPCFF